MLRGAFSDKPLMKKSLKYRLIIWTAGVLLLFVMPVEAQTPAPEGDVDVVIIDDIGPATENAPQTPPLSQRIRRDDLFAEIHTSYGVIKIQLFGIKTPRTVENFVGLATGEKAFTEIGGKAVKRRFYDGLTVHKVVRDNVIYSGCPFGNGRGGPGYQFPDEILEEFNFDKPGMVAMSNFGQNTNGSQFFITLTPRPDLNGKYTIFGRVIDGLHVARRISQAPINGLNRPLEEIKIQAVEINWGVGRGLATDQ